MFEDIKKNVSDWNDDKEISAYLLKILNKEVFDQTGLIYGMGHPVYSINVDFYSGFVYTSLNIPHQLFTPLFAISRIVGWSAHRIEEIVNADKIIRPAYKSIAEKNQYTPIGER